MKNAFRIALAAAIVLSAAARESAMAQEQLVPVIATGDQQRSFAGVWRGSVVSADPRFAGPVEFRFAPGGALVLRSRPAPSRILWLRMTGHGIAGALEPYFDSARGADVYTTFEATVSGRTLTGVLRERVHMQWRDAARWTVRRVPD